MDDKKVDAIQYWEEPETVQEVRSFLGLENYYRIFLEGYSIVTVPFIELLKKNKAWK